MASGDDGGMMRATPPGPAYPPQQQQQENVQKIHKVIFISYICLCFPLYAKTLKSFRNSMLY